MSIDAGTEVRVIDPSTGGEKGQKDAVLGDIDPMALVEVAKVCGFGRKKYARLNYLRGYDWSSSYDALQRHLNLFWNREEQDPESGLHHLAHAAWHCFALFSFSLRGLGTDDRPFPPDTTMIIDYNEDVAKFLNDVSPTPSKPRSTRKVGTPRKTKRANG